MPVADEADDEHRAVLLPVGHEDAAGEQDAPVGTGSAGRGGRVVHLDKTEHALFAGDGVEPQRPFHVE